MKNSRSNSLRSLRVEPLEPRCVMSGDPIGAAPQIFLDPFNSEVSEGQAFVITGRVLDNDTPTSALTATVGYGFGDEPVTIAPDGTFRVEHLPTYQGSVEVTLTVSDDQNNQTTEVFRVEVVNVLPLIDVHLNSPAVVGQPINVSGSFVDPGNDEWTGEVYYNYVDEGNSGDPEPLQLNADKTFNLSHIYDAPGDYTIRIVINDGNSEVPTFGEAYLVISVTGTPTNPPVIPPQRTTIDEGQSASFVINFSDPDVGQGHTVFVDYGAGYVPVTAGADGKYVVSKFYGQDSSDIVGGAFMLPVRVVDSGGATADATYEVFVNNVAPSVDARPDQVIYVGETADKGLFSFTDPGLEYAGNGDPLWQYEVFLDGVLVRAKGDLIVPNTDYPAIFSGLSVGVHSATIKVSDDDSFGFDFFTITVLNSESPNNPPVVPPQQTTINEGQSASFVINFSDEDPGDTHTVLVDFGAGYVPITPDVNGDYNITKFYGQDSSDIVGGAFSLPVRVVDASGATADATYLVFVNNVAPSVDARPDQVIYVGESADEGLFSFTDPGQEYASNGAPLWRYELYLNGVLTLPKGNPVVPSTDYAAIFNGLPVGTYNVTVQVYDDDSLGSDSFVIHVLPKEVPPVDPPVTPPVTPPVAPPVTPPVTPPVVPPATPPVVPPVTPPFTPPVAPPVTPPVTPPVVPPATPPATPPKTPPNVAPPLVFFPPTTPAPIPAPPLVPTLPPIAIPLPAYIPQPAQQAIIPPASYYFFSEQHYPPIPHLADRTIDEGSVMEYRGWFDDADQVDSWRGRVDYGDGSGWQDLVIEPGRRFTLQHLYSQDGDYRVIVEIYDSYGLWGRDTMTVHVNNVAPAVTINGKKNWKVDKNVELGGAFKDPGADIFTGVVDYGDGSKPEGVVLNGKSFKLVHKYDKTGKYIVTVKIFDGKANGAAEFAVEVEGAQAPGAGENATSGGEQGNHTGESSDTTLDTIDAGVLDDIFANEDLTMIALGVTLGGIYVGNRERLKRKEAGKNSSN